MQITLTDLLFLNREKTIIQAKRDDTFITIEKDYDVYDLFDRCISGEFGPILESDFDLNEEMSKRNIVISKLQAKIILFQYGILEAVEELIKEQPEIIQIAWREASEFEYLSPTIQALKDAIVLPDGSTISEEQWEQMFLEAKDIRL